MTYEFDIKTGQYIDRSVMDISDSALSVKSSAISVSEALQIAKVGLESINVFIIGEVSQVSQKPGYAAVYFTIKDKNSSLPCLMWKNKFNANSEELKVGSLVEVKGRFSLYKAKGRMNFDVNSFSLAGEGRLRQLVCEIEKRLRSKGLMDADKKKDIPDFCQKIGVITSPRGSVIHDIIRTVNRRMPISTIVFAGCAVEGQNAAQNIIKAFDCLETSDIDVIILARGGGSYEDLMPFNDEDLALRIARCQKVVITGIGHEPDTTIADLVADKRASTPTAAAEAVSQNLNEVIKIYTAKLSNVKHQFKNALVNNINYINEIIKKPIFQDPLLLFSKEFQTLDFAQSSIIKAGNQMLSKFNQEFNIASAKLNERSPFTIMSRGYSITKDDAGRVVHSVNQAKKGSKVFVNLKDGKLDCVVNEVVDA